MALTKRRHQAQQQRLEDLQPRPQIPRSGTLSDVLAWRIAQAARDKICFALKIARDRKILP